MTGPTVQLEHHDGGVVLLRLARPPLNALSVPMLAELAAGAARLRGDDTVKAVVVAGSERAFAAGADIEELTTADPGDVAGAFRAACDGLVGIPRPVIAAVRGFALGGGLEVALACDLRVAGESARLGQPESLLGIVPGGGATQRLPRLVGAARAKELIWSGRHLRAAEAAAIGLVDRVVPDDEVEGTALAWARSFATGAVAAIGLAKQAIEHGLDGPLDAGLDLERDAFIRAFDTEDATIGIRSFLDHGTGHATFHGR